MRLAGGAHGLEDGDLPGLFHHHHEQGAGDAEGGHQDDEGEDDEHGDLFQLQGREEAAVHLHPVLGVEAGPQFFLNFLGHLRRGVNILDLHFQAGDAAAQPQEFLEGRDAGEDQGVIEFVHAGVEDGAHPEGLHPGHAVPWG